MKFMVITHNISNLGIKHSFVGLCTLILEKIKAKHFQTLEIIYRNHQNPEVSQLSLNIFGEINGIYFPNFRYCVMRQKQRKCEECIFN